MDEHHKKIGPGIEERNFDFKHFALKYLKYWYVFIISIVVAFFIARYYNWYTSPIYKSSCRLIIKDENSNNSAENILKDLSNMKRNVNLENEIQILKSKTLVTKAIEQLELNISYLQQGSIKSTELYTRSPFMIKIDTLNELAYFVDLDIAFLDQNTFQI
jgi:tyrosine-protein kinase Etk/Wzc